MTPHYTDPLVTLYLGDCLDVMRDLPDASVDSVVTDPPYGLEFMGKEWDSLRPGINRGGQAPGRSERQADKLAPVEYGGAKTRTSFRCDSCGKSDKFQNPHGCDSPTWTRTYLQPDHGGYGRAMQAWHEQWATEAFRVLKPGGYILAFGGTRTYHRLASAIEDAGFEIRDTLMWIYASGFPKSLDVSKALDKLNGREFADRVELAKHIKERREASGFTKATVNSWFGYRDGCQHWERTDDGNRVPTLSDWSVLLRWMDLDRERFLPLIERVEAERQKVATGQSGPASVAFTRKNSVYYDITAPATDLARKWEGWGTALKPAHEPIVMARKPLVGTVAANVTRYGTGALNIDGARIAVDPNDPVNGAVWTVAPSSIDRMGLNNSNKSGDNVPATAGEKGRWPSNVLLSDLELFDEPNPYVVGSGATTQGSTPIERPEGFKRFNGTDYNGGEEYVTGGYTSPGYSDGGGYSRFFLIPKADRAERERGLANVQPSESMYRGLPDPRMDRPQERTARANVHPTVKPIDLMRHLVKLVTPPGGTCLDPFLGSGTTALAASELGIKCIGIEREAEYIEIAKGRLMATPMGLGLDVPAPTKKRKLMTEEESAERVKSYKGHVTYSGGWGWEGEDGEDAA